MFSTDTEEQARSVIVATCSRGLDGQYYSHDLAADQTLENLDRLGDKMERAYNMIAARRPASERGEETT